MTSHEEADVMIIHQMVKAAETWTPTFRLFDGDIKHVCVFVLLLHFYTKLNLTCHLTMEGPSAERTATTLLGVANV